MVRKKYSGLLLLLIVSLSFISSVNGVFADVQPGSVSGEIVLDQVDKYDTKAGINEEVSRVSFVTNAIDTVRSKLFSNTADDFENQFQNKQNAQSQNKDLDIAKKNLEQSKEHLSTMFFFIVATLTVLFDVILSIVYILLLVLLVWIVFIGYAKFLMMVVEFVAGKLEKKGVKL